MADKQTERRAKLLARFEAQARFCKASSPLYHHLFASLGRRLLDDDEFAAWLLHASSQRASFDVPLLLLAGLHLSVLRYDPKVSKLAAYYPSVGGAKNAHAAAFAGVLADAIDALREELAHFIASSPVQTNEGARGLCWLLPLAYTGWPQVHLVELGASAGLNLVAEQRRYCLVQAGKANADIADTPDTGDSAEHTYRFGQGREEAFFVQGQGSFAAPAAPASSLRILSRRGCDLSPISLQSEQERTRLAAFVWADQTARMAMLNSGMELVAKVNSTEAPVELPACTLPEELPGFLHNLPALRAPSVLYNTYLTAYLPDKGRSLHAEIDHWARQEAQPLLWLQWEHLRSQESSPPEFGWLAWTADLWRDSQHQHWHLAWMHPHGNRVSWLPGLQAWHEFCAKNL